jgi:hypothetical protein
MKREVYPAKVLNNEDVDKSGAAKIQVNDLVDNSALDDTDFTPGRYPFAGRGEGFYYAPQEQSLLEVEVAEDEEESVEDLNARWVGMLYSSDDSIPEEFQSDHTKRGGIKFGDEVFLQDKTKALTSLISSKVRLGEEEASHPLNRGDTYNEELVKFLDALDVYLAAESTYVGLCKTMSDADATNAGVWAALGAGVPILGSHLNASAALIGGPATALSAGSTAFQAAIATFRTAVAAFKAAKETWLSTKCKTE